MKIVRYGACDDIDVEFLDDFHYIKTTTYSNFVRGQVKNPYDRDLFGVGYIGVGKWKVKHNGKWSRVYLCWRHMIERCYHRKSSKQYPAYYGICTVCDEWHNFQIFAEWYKEREYECKGRLHLDKDIKNPGNTVYSPENCLLVPQRINELFTCKPKENGLPVGISLSTSGKYVASYNGKHLGTYSELKDAYKIYAITKEMAIQNAANEYKEIIPHEIYEILMKYKVLIENDKNYLPS